MSQHDGGGEEFALLLPDTNEVGAKKVCEDLRKAFEELRVEHETRAYQVTVTFGIFSSQDSTAPMEHWINCADNALYLGKRNGRNRVEVYSPDTDSLH